MTRIYGYYEYRGREWNLHGEDKDFNIDKVIRTGLELETEPSGNTYDQDATADFIYNTLDNKNVCATDGSLKRGGIEIITEPMTPTYLLNNYSDKFKTLLNGLSNTYNYQSHNGGHCGLHIHFTRPFNKGTEEDINFYNKLCFIFESFKEPIKQLSRRTNFEYCNYFSDANRNADAREYKSIYGLSKKDLSGSHSYMLNNCNENTIEVRILRGTLNYDTFIASYKIIVNLFNLAFKDIKELNGLSFKKAINYYNDLDIKKYINDKQVNTDFKLYDYSKQLIKLEHVVNSILLNSNKYLNKAITELLKESKKIKMNNKSIEDLKAYYNGLYSYIDKIDYINSTINNINKYIDKTSDYYSYNELLDQLRYITQSYTTNNAKIEDLFNKIKKELNKEF